MTQEWKIVQNYADQYPFQVIIVNKEDIHLNCSIWTTKEPMKDNMKGHPNNLSNLLSCHQLMPFSFYVSAKLTTNKTLNLKNKDGTTTREYTWRHEGGNDYIDHVDRYQLRSE